MKYLILTQTSIKLWSYFTDVEHPCLSRFTDCSGWRSLPAGPSGEVQAGLCVWAGCVSARETNGYAPLRLQWEWLQPFCSELLTAESLRNYLDQPVALLLQVLTTCSQIQSTLYQILSFLHLSTTLDNLKERGYELIDPGFFPISVVAQPYHFCCIFSPCSCFK